MTYLQINMSSFNIWVIILLLPIVRVTGGLECLSCVDVLQPRLCHYIRHCHDGQVCVTEKFQTPDGLILYDLGCRNNDTCSEHGGGSRQTRTGNRITLELCSDCCNSSLCNAAGCGAPAYPSNIGPVCYNCPQSRDVAKCDTIAICKEDESCFIQEENELGETFLQTRCIQNDFCHINQPNLVGRRNSKREIKCSRCCDGNLCNNVCAISQMNDSTALSTVSIVNITTSPTQMTKTNPVCIDNGGTEFVLMFIPNFDHTREHIELLVTSFEGTADIEFVSSVVGISSNITLRKKSAHINIPNESIQHDEKVRNKGLYIKSNKPISVHGISVYSPGCCTSGGFTALSLQYLGTDYIVVSGLVFKLSQIGLVGAYDNTVVRITLNTTSIGSVQFDNHTYMNGDTISVSLDKLDTVQLGSTADLTGTRIQSNNPIGVLSGNQCDKMISDDCDFSVDMLPPVTKWGRKFVVPSINPTRIMVLRVVPSDHDVRIELQSNVTDIIYPATSNTIEVRLLSLDVTIVYCSKPCLVVQFSADTFMTLVPPIEQFSHQYILETPSLKSFSNYALITVETRHASGLRYNGNPVPGASRTLTDRQNISWTSITMPIGIGTNVIDHTSSQVYFGVLQYGFEYSIAPEAYAFPVSFRESCGN